MRNLAPAIFRFAASRLSPAGRGAKLSILIFHRVLAEPDPLFPREVTVSTFDAQMRWLKATCNVLPLPEAVERMKSGTLPTRAASITFDDGYADNHTLALPILQRHGLHATFFIATAYLNGGRMFNDTVIEGVRRSPLTTLDLRELDMGVHPLDSHPAKAQAIGKILRRVKYLPLGAREDAAEDIARRAGGHPLPDDLMMTTDQVRALQAAGMEIGGHTHRHPILAGLSANEAEAEIAAGMSWLQNTLGTPVRLFAYPNGKPGTDYLPGQSEILRRLGLDAAVSTQRGASTSEDDVYQLRRFTPWDTKPIAYGMRLLQNLAVGRTA
jgi:peptidoglycan/xylan/chitin deacetylase (PgdA/CDA1 family)